MEILFQFELKQHELVRNDVLIYFLAWYKQATVGTCKEKGGGQPWAVQVEYLFDVKFYLI